MIKVQGAEASVRIEKRLLLTDSPGFKTSRQSAACLCAPATDESHNLKEKSL